LSELIEYKTDKSGLAESDILNLYQKVGWTVYTNDPQKLMRALENSRDVITAWQDETLVGLIRTVGDGETIIYIQDILVLPEYHRDRIGSVLLKKVLEKYPDVRQKVLLTDETYITRQFYQANNFTNAEELNLLCYVRIEG